MTSDYLLILFKQRNTNGNKKPTNLNMTFNSQKLILWVLIYKIRNTLSTKYVNINEKRNMNAKILDGQ